MLAAFDLVDVAPHFGRISEEVFAMMAGIVLLPATAPIAEECFAATLRFREPVGMALLLECEPKAAYAISARLLSTPEEPQSFNEDVRDSLGEMVNMVGGNLRNFFPELQSLDATPSVYERAAEAKVGKPIIAMVFRCEYGHVRLSLC